MRVFIIAVLAATVLALIFALVLNSVQETSEIAFTTMGVRLAATPIPGGEEKLGVSDLVNGGFVVLGAIIAAAAGYLGAIAAAKTQVKALEDQTEEERRRLAAYDGTDWPGTWQNLSTAPTLAGAIAHPAYGI
jgi:hypothetical protein